MHAIFFTMVFLLEAFALAAPFRTTYQAKIIKPDGQPLQASSVNFKFTILDPAATCVIYSEDYTAVNMFDSGGVVAFSLGAGVRSFPTSGTAATFSNIFDNSTPSFSCQTLGVYMPTSNDGRKIVMQFNDGTGWQTLPAMTINAVPYSMYAGKSENSIQLNGKFDTAFVQYSSLTGLNCQANEAIHFNGVSFSCLAVGGGSVTSGSVITALGYTPADAASFTTLSNSLSTTSSNISSVSSTVSSLQTSVAASFAAVKNSQWLTTGSAISYNSGNVGIGTSNPTTRLEISNGSAPLTANFDALSISAYNIDWGYPVSATIGLTKTTYGNSWGEAMEFKYTSPDPGVLPPQYIFRGSSNTSDVVMEDGRVMGRQYYANDYIYVSRANTNNPAYYAFLPSTNYTNYDFIQVQAASGSVYYAGAVSAAGAVTGYYTNVTSGSYQIRTSNVDRLTVTSAGAVGVGTVNPVTRLDVAGGLRIGTESAACALGFAGTLRYASATVEYCNGSNWQAFSTGSVTSSSVIAALGYTPANSATVTSIATSTTVLTTSVNNLTTSMSTIATSATTMSASINALSASMAAVTSSQWSTNGSTINYMTGNVGIGTTTPQAKLSVIGTRQSSITPTNSIFQVGGADVFLFMGAGNGIGNPYPIMLQAMRDSDSVAFPLALNPNGGNVGVGTMSPSYPLAVVGNIKSQLAASGNSTGITLGNEGTEQPKIEFNASDNSRRFYLKMQGVNTSAERLTLYAGPLGNGATNEAVTFSGNGSVGIGTSAPAAALHVGGSAGIIMTERNSGDGFGAHHVFQKSRGTPAAPTIVSSGDEITTLWGRAYDGSTYQTAARIKMLVDGTPGVSDTPGRIEFTTTPDGAYTEQTRMVIKNDGFVGIGTTNPSRKLHIKDQYPYLAFEDTENASGSIGTITYNQDGYFYFDADNPDTGTDAGFRFRANGGTKQLMAITNAGNVGIGTTAPAAKLDVFGSTYFASRKGYANYYNVGPYDQMEFGAIGAATALSLVTSGVSRLNITPTGYVGVGTTFPETNLQLGPSAYFGIPANGYTYVPAAWRRGNGGGLIMGGSQNADGSGWAYGTRIVNHDYGDGLALSFDALYQGTWTNDVLVVSGRNGLGNVGIGKASPATKLDVAGNITNGGMDFVLGNLDQVSRGNSGNSRALVKDTGTVLVINYAGDFPGGTAIRGAGGSTNFYVSGAVNGNVGVGTTGPSEKLHVVGNLRVQGSTDCTLGNGAGGTNCSSDERLKENIKPIPYALEKVISLKGVEFDWNEKSLSHGRHDIGVIAQDVEKVFPTAVMNDKNTGYKKVDYAVLVAPLIQAFKEFYSYVINRFEKQDRQIASKADSAEMQALKVKTEKLEAENLQLKKRNEAIQTYLCSQNPSAPFCK